jgi:hypothetical protein
MGKKKTIRLICQRCFHFIDEHPKNLEDKRPCAKEMQFTGMSVFCYCDAFDFIGKWKPRNFITGV